VSMVAIAFTPPAAQAISTSDEAGLAGSWLRGQQNDDGGFPSSPDGDSSVGMTARSMLGLAATGINPLDVKSGGNNPYEYLLANRKKLDDASDLALVILALKTVGQNPRDFKGRDLVTALHVRRGNKNSYGDNVNVSAYAALAFRSAEADGAKKRVINWLISAQNFNTGGWGISSKAKSDPDSTGTVLQIMHGKKNIRPAMKYLKKTQKDSGGWANSGTVNSQTTALALQGAMASGKSREYLKSNGNSGLDYLLARQTDDGSVWYSKSSDQTRVWVTADTAIAISGETLPVEQPPLEDKANDADVTGGGASPPSGSSSSSSSTTTPNLYNDTSSSSGSSGNGSNSGSGGNGGSGNGGGGSSSSGKTSGQGPPDTEVPPLSTDIPVVPVAPTEAVLAASRQGDEPSPLIAILIFLVVSGGLAGGTVLLARRMKW